MLLATIPGPIRVLTRIGVLVDEKLDEAIKSTRNAGTEHGAQPIDPMVTGKTPRHDLRAKTARGIQARAREISAAEMGDEERKADADGRQKGRLRFLDGEHEHGDHE